VKGTQALQSINPNPETSNPQRLTWKGQELQSRVASASYTIEPPPLAAPKSPSPSANPEPPSPAHDPTEAHQSPDLPTASSPAPSAASTSPDEASTDRKAPTAPGQEKTVPPPPPPPRAAPPSPPSASQPPLAAEADKPGTHTPPIASPRENPPPCSGSDPSNDDVAPSVAPPPPLPDRPSQQQQQQQQASRARGAMAPPPLPATGRGRKIIYNGKEVHSKVYQATVSSTVKQQTKAAVTRRGGGVAGRASPSPASAVRVPPVVSAGNMFGRAQIGATLHSDNAAATAGTAQGLGGWATGGGKPGSSPKHLGAGGGTGTRFAGGVGRGNGEAS